MLTRVTNALPRRQAAHLCRLAVVAGPDAGTEVTIPAVGVVVGADASADVVLHDDAASKRHATVAPAEQGFLVTDLGSRNGTYLDDIALSRATVPLGAVLRIGRSLLQLMPAEESATLPPSQASSFGGMLGSSLAMRQVYAVLERASLSAAAILFQGGSGTGKELAARAVHDASPRASAPFVVFDCGAASDSLVASDLFGHVRGAFTGAQSDRIGAFAAADGGTLFLDEIGDLPLALQPKLLRLLETGEVTPLGGTRTERHDVRVVAATHRDLWEEVGRGAFRGDLYYRLAVVEVHLPPLRARLEDLPELVRAFLRRAGAPSESGVDSPNLDRLRAYHWPGNVRELRNVITRAVALAPPGAHFAEMPVLLRPTVTATDTEPPVRADRSFHEAKAEILERFERAYLADLLRRSGDNLSEAARIAGLERKYLYRILDRYGIRRKKETGE